MRNHTAIRWGRNPALATLLLLGFVSRALIPMGFMPGPGGLVICTGYAAAVPSEATGATGHDMAAMEMAGMDMSGMEMAHGAGHAKGDGSPERGHPGMCPFAAAAATMASHQVAVTIAAVPAAVRQVALPVLPFVPRRTIVPTRLPRGPPLLG